MEHEDHNSIRVLDLFSGVGGSSLGARKAGASIAAAIDTWDLACETYSDNFPAAKVYTSKCEDLDPTKVKEEIGDINLLIASPECTSHTCAKGSGERSDDSRNFTMIARVNGRQGNFDQAYRYADQKATGLIYYRLRLVDKHGSAAYSHIVSLKCDEPMKANSTAVFEKSTQRILLQHGGDGFLPGTQARLLDMNGRMLTTVRLAAAKVQYLQTGFLAKGVYLVQLAGKQGNETLKVMVQ